MIMPPGRGISRPMAVLMLGRRLAIRAVCGLQGHLGHVLANACTVGDNSHVLAVKHEPHS
jgi:hypothetical protein